MTPQAQTSENIAAQSQPQSKLIPETGVPPLPSPTSSVAPKSPAFQQVEVGHVMSVAASKAIATISNDVIRKNQIHLAQIGTILKIVTRKSTVVVMVSSLKIGGADDEGLSNSCIAELDILGEIMSNNASGEARFYRGVRTFPVLSEPVFTLSLDELELIFNRGNEASIEVGHLHQNSSIVAKVRTDDLLSKHFAILGSTGSGKSCAVALVIRATLETNPNAHVVLFDPHNEYAKSFGDMAEVINHTDLNLPLWLFNFDETVELLTSETSDKASEEEQVLHDVILKAKKLYEHQRANPNLSTQIKAKDLEKELSRVDRHISLDSPIPYRIRDVLKLITHEMGRLENSSNISPYKRLKRRIETLLADPRYQFVFRNQAAAVPIEDIIGQIFRVPVNGRPLCILDFSGIPSDCLNIVVSVISRLAFDLAMWSERKVPILLVCEEAHRYIPSDPNLGFRSTRKAISRIAKEGRKYGVSLGIVSQRPSELETSVLSQCNTIFSMRLSNEVDQQFVRAAMPDGADELLSFLPSLGTAETMIFGESVNMPMRVILNTLEEEYRPHSSSAKFTELWVDDNMTPNAMRSIFDNWRARHILKDDNSPEMKALKERVDDAKAKRVDADQRAQRPAPISRSDLKSALPKTHAEKRAQTLADVKRMINGAFHQDM